MPYQIRLSPLDEDAVVSRGVGVREAAPQVVFGWVEENKKGPCSRHMKKKKKSV